MDVKRRGLLWILGQTGVGLRDLYEGLPVQPRFQRMASQDLAQTGAIAVAQGGALARPQSRRTGKARHMVGGLSPLSGPIALKILRDQQDIPVDIAQIALATQRHRDIHFLVKNLQRFGHASLPHRA